MVVVIAPIEIATAPRRYRPANRCIYCGKCSGKLTAEHIIPFGLAANSLVLPKAACDRCRKETGRLENTCLRHLWWPFRTRIGAPSRGKQSPSNFKMRRIKVKKQHQDGSIDYDPVSETEVAPDEFPLVYVALKLPRPAILTGRDPGEIVNYEVWARVSEEEFRKYAPGDKDGFHVAPIEPATFCRMLAKIAHAYAAELGQDAFKPFLAGIINGKEFRPSEPIGRLFEWIGGIDKPHNAEPNLHQIGWRIEAVGKRNLVVVELRLFSFMGSPSYHIVVGELTSPSDQLPFPTQPLYIIDVKGAIPSADLVSLSGAAERTAS